MGSADALRKYAAWCVGKAQAAQDDIDKAVWLGMAQAWLRLAQDAAGFREHFGDAHAPRAAGKGP